MIIIIIVIIITRKSSAEKKELAATMTLNGPPAVPESHTAGNGTPKRTPAFSSFSSLYSHSLVTQSIHQQSAHMTWHTHREIDLFYRTTARATRCIHPRSWFSWGWAPPQNIGPGTDRASRALAWLQLQLLHQQQ